ncbi:MAG: hypothetical protein QM779_04885 [Propionicimonas sp.]|uniref:hypothetical protein n=1 Tax=Propionicimonas sp. TaxID=1955623 RepID=UPI003D138FDE
MKNHVIIPESAPSRSRVDVIVQWSCSTCGEQVGRTWRTTDGLYAESTWQHTFEPEYDQDTLSYEPGWTARQFVQSVVRAREHLLARHMRDLHHREVEEIAIAAKSSSQGQTLAPANTSSDAAAHDSVNSVHTPGPSTGPTGAQSQRARAGDPGGDSATIRQQVFTDVAALENERHGLRPRSITPGPVRSAERKRQLWALATWAAVREEANQQLDYLMQSAVRLGADQRDVARMLGVSPQAVNQKLKRLRS